LAAHAQNKRTETGIPRVAMVQGAIPEHLLAAVYEPMINDHLAGIEIDDRRAGRRCTTIRRPIS
jgi:hypothetical protein